MTIADLTAYASSKYHIEEEHKWEDFPGYSVLVNPYTGKWAALLMRRWDQDTGSEVEVCDIKCGSQVLKEIKASYLVPPFRMHGSKWVGVRFCSIADPAVVCGLFDRAVHLGEQRGYTIVLDNHEKDTGHMYRETKLPAREAGRRRSRASKPSQRGIPERPEDVSLTGDASGPPQEEAAPGMIRKMRKLYFPGDGSIRQRSMNFYIQGMFMKDYEDTVPWNGNLRLFFPSYHDLNTRQLRGYFAWRSGARRGEYAETCESFVYIYVFELLNGIGVDSPQESLNILEKLIEASGNAGWLEADMRENLERWMFDFSVLNGLPADTVQKYMKPGILRTDRALCVLTHPEACPDREVVSALSLLSGINPDSMPAVQQNEEEGIHLIAEVWRRALSGCREEGRDLFELCFGKMYSFRWNPMRNALFRQKAEPEPAEYRVNDCRTYFYDGSEWMERCYRKLYFDRELMAGLFHETDRQLRQYLKTGRALRKRQKEAWAEPYVDAAIEADRRAKEEAARRKIEIDFSGLDRIRQDAVITRDSLLVETPEDEPEELTAAEERAAGTRENQADAGSTPVPCETEADGTEPGLQQEEPETPEKRILQALLRGDSADDLIREHYLMPSIAADMINEAFFDQFGDNIVDCDGDTLFLIEDYTEELKDVFLTAGMRKAEHSE